MRPSAPLVLGCALVLGCGPKQAPEPSVPETTDAGSAQADANAPPPDVRCGVQPDGSRSFRVLHLNDVYRIGGLSDGRGGLSRVRTLRAQLQVGCEDGVLLTHAGDMLFPSMLSRVFDGAQMIDVLNHLDGDGEAFDDQMVAVFGNHEFDKPAMKYAPMVQERVRDSQFAWLDTNITWAEVEGAPAISADNLHKSVLLDVGGVKVGVFGMTIDNKIPEYAAGIDTDHTAIAREQTRSLRAAGAEVVLALTHLDANDDDQLLTELGDEGPDAVLGGHDHVLQSAVIGGRPMLKGDADAVRVRVLDITVGADGAVSWSADQAGVHIGEGLQGDDPGVQTVIDRYMAEFDREFCGDQPDCLSEQLTIAKVTLGAEETKIRRFETNLGDWVTDQMRRSFPQADVAVINSGALRLNQDVPAGQPVTRGTVEAIFAYPARMHLIEIDGATLEQVLQRSVSGWTGQGHWLQVSGVVFRQDSEAEAVSDIHLQTADGLVPLDKSAKYKLVTVRYLLDPEMGDQDGYTMLSLSQQVDAENNGTDLKPQVLDALRTMGEAGFAPKREGRICNAQESGAPCLLE